MKLKEFLTEALGEEGEQEITSLAFDTADVKKGGLFFALNGFSIDGHKFVAAAREKGAVCAVVEKFVPDPIAQVLVKSTRSALAQAAQNFFGRPFEKLISVGITGTNGKTTTSFILRSILEAAGKKVGVIGTNGIFIGKDRYETKLTTPDPIEYNRMLALMVNGGVEIVISEVSAHSLALSKLDGMRFDYACFTNLTQDHLDFFRNMQNYKAAKLKFFTPEHSKNAVVNVDDETGLEIARTYRGKVYTYGLKNPSDVFAIEEEFGEDGIKTVLNLFDEVVRVKSNLCGRFNVYNISCAATVAYLLGVKPEAIAKGVRNVTRVDGRFNIISASNYSIIIDFAHTEDGLKNAISSIREFAKGKIITVFGCGGDRDRSKRPMMGAVASKLSDFCVITSDNPRSENPLDIIEDVKKGMTNDAYAVVPKRKEAIRFALSMAGEGDIVFIAGKGAEKYQEINGIKYAYNDEEFIMELIKENVVQ